MARDPDAMEERHWRRRRGRRRGRHPYGGPGGEFATGPSRAERAMPRARSSQPLWPWLIVILLVVAGAAIYLLATG